MRARRNRHSEILVCVCFAEFNIYYFLFIFHKTTSSKMSSYRLGTVLSHRKPHTFSTFIGKKNNKNMCINLLSQATKSITKLIGKWKAVWKEREANENKGIRSVKIIRVWSRKMVKRNTFLPEMHLKHHTRFTGNEFSCFAIISKWFNTLLAHHWMLRRGKKSVMGKLVYTFDVRNFIFIYFSSSKFFNNSVCCLIIICCYGYDCTLYKIIQ